MLLCNFAPRAHHHWLLQSKHSLSLEPTRSEYSSMATTLFLIVWRLLSVQLRRSDSNHQWVTIHHQCLNDLSVPIAVVFWDTSGSSDQDEAGNGVMIEQQLAGHHLTPGWAFAKRLSARCRYLVDECWQQTAAGNRVDGQDESWLPCWDTYWDDPFHQWEDINTWAGPLYLSESQVNKLSFNTTKAVIIFSMAPSIQQLPEEIPVPSIEKLAIHSSKSASEAVQIPKVEAPKVKRQIDLEGGKTDAKVRSKDHAITSLTNKSIRNTCRPGTMGRNTLHWSHSITLNMARMPTPLSKTSFRKAAKSRNSPRALALKSLASSWASLQLLERINSLFSSPSAR